MKCRKNIHEAKTKKNDTRDVTCTVRAGSHERVIRGEGALREREGGG